MSGSRYSFRRGRCITGRRREGGYHRPVRRAEWDRRPARPNSGGRNVARLFCFQRPNPRVRVLSLVRNADVTMMGTSSDEGARTGALGTRDLVRADWRRFSLVFVCIWALLGTGGAWLTAFLGNGDRARYDPLVDHGRVASNAVVTATDPGDHNTVYYEFTVSGISYSSSDFSDPPNRDAGALSVGERLHVVYDVDNPSDSCSCTPSAAAKANSEISWIVIGYLWVSAIAFALALQAMRSVGSPRYRANWAARSRRAGRSRSRGR